MILLRRLLCMPIGLFGLFWLGSAIYDLFVWEPWSLAGSLFMFFLSYVVFAFVWPDSELDAKPTSDYNFEALAGHFTQKESATNNPDKDCNDIDDEDLTDGEEFEFEYCDKRGEVSERHVLIHTVGFGQNGIYVEGYDLGKQAQRTFLVSGISRVFKNGRYITTSQWKYFLRNENDFVTQAEDYDALEIY